MKDCIESYRKNYGMRYVHSNKLVCKASDSQIANSTETHWIAFKTAWAACNTVYREKYKREKARRIVAEEKLTELIDPRR